MSNSAIRSDTGSARRWCTPSRYGLMPPSLGRTPVPGIWGTEAMGRTLRTLSWSSSMRRARPVATDRRHTFGVAATGRAMLSNQNNSVSVCNRVTTPLTSPGAESEARAMTKRKRRLDSGMVALKLDSWTPLGEQGTEPVRSVQDVPRRRERPVAAGEPFAPAIAERELSHVGDGQSRGTEPEREPGVATQPRRLGCVPGAPVVEVWCQADAEQAPHLVLHHEPVLESDPGLAGAGEGVRPEQAGALAVAPEIEFVPRLGPAQRAALQMKDERLAGQVLARDGHAAEDTPRVHPRAGEDTVRLTAQHGEPVVPDSGDLAARLGTHARTVGLVAPGARRRPDPEPQDLREVHVFLVGEGIEVLEHLKAHLFQLHPCADGPELRAGEGHRRCEREVLASPARAEPEPGIARPRGAQRHTSGEAEQQQPVLHAVGQGAVMKLQHALFPRGAVRYEGPGSDGLVEGHAEGPRPAVAVRNGLVLPGEHRAATEQAGAAVPNAHAVTVGGLFIAPGQRGAAAEQIPLHERHRPQHVAGDGRVVEVRDGTPGVVRLHSQGETLAVHALGVDAHGAKDRERSQRPLALGHLGGIVGVASFDQQGVAHDPRERGDVQRVPDTRHDFGRVTLAIVHVVPHHDDRVDRLGDEGGRRTDGQQCRREPERTRQSRWHAWIYSMLFVVRPLDLALLGDGRLARVHHCDAYNVATLLVMSLFSLAVLDLINSAG